MNKINLDQLVKQAIARFPDATDSIMQMANQVVNSGNAKAIELYAEELHRQLSSNDSDSLQHIRHGAKHIDQWPNVLSEGFGFKFWSYILPRLLRLIIIVAAVIYAVMLMLEQY